MSTNSNFYPIKPEIYEPLLISFNVGSSIAENDPLLEVAKIETQEFYDLFNDRIDLVKGVKGSGKTALFKLFYYLRAHMLGNRKVLLIQGVEAIGDPVFKYYQKEFDSFSESDFQHFWRIYFIKLIIDNFLKDTETFPCILIQDEDLEEFYKECETVGLPIIEKKKTLRDMVESILAWLKSVKSVEPTVSVKTDPSSTIAYSASLKVGVERENAEEEKTPLFVSNLRDILSRILEICELRIWIMLDRLDEVFLRRSTTEINGLRALLKSAYSFSNPHLRIKIFLRDDILEAIISAIEGFTGLSHITSRSCRPINWSKEQIIHLIVKRVFAAKPIADFFKVDVNVLDKDPNYRKDVFYRIFPEQVIKGGNQPNCIDWIYTRCQDGRGVISPRDVIELLDFSKQSQFKMFKANPQPQDIFISSAALRDGFDQLSVTKRDTYLRAEFPQFWAVIEKFQNGRAEHDETSLSKLFGKSWPATVEDLRNIGFLSVIPTSKTFKIPMIWRHGLGIKQGKAFQ